MYMAPIAQASAPLPPLPLRRAVGIPMLAVAGLVIVPWLLAVLLMAGVLLLARVGMEAADYAAQFALGR